MINLLILYELNKTPLTMYGIAKHIKEEFAVLLTPSIGTIQPALKRLESLGYISSQKYMSKGGRPSTCYAINENGKAALIDELLSEMPDNPIQFLVNARIRLYCAKLLNKEDSVKLINILKKRVEIIKSQTEKLAKNSDLEFYPQMVFENLTCEYNNFLLLLEGIEHACKG